MYAAHQQLVGSLPLSMSFDAPNGFQIPIYELHEIMEDFHVDIHIRPKKSQGSKSVLIKTQERNASAIYAARFRLLKSKDLDQFVSQHGGRPADSSKLSRRVSKAKANALLAMI